VLTIPCSPVSGSNLSARPPRETGGSGYFAGAVNTDARHGVYNYVVGDQKNYKQATDALDVDRILATLKPVGRGGYYVPQCMKGTREDIFNKIDRWFEKIDAPNILWLDGNPGAGKSTIASTLISRLAKRPRPCSSFFFRRGDIKLSDPAALWPTIAHHLAEFNPRFASVLIPVLKEKKIDLTRPDIDLHFKALIHDTLLNCYDHSSPHTIPVILIDALDECGCDHFRDAQRKAFIDTLVQWSHLPWYFKLIITSRNERIPESFRAACENIVLPTGDEVSADANNDVRHFFNERFAELGGSMYPAWPGEQILIALTTRAAGLFIWAETVMRFVEQGLPEEQLELVLSGDLGEEDNITTLYRQILEFSFRDMKGRVLEVYKVIVSTIVLAKTPLHCDDLYEFVSQPKTSVKFILDKLSSVISIGSSDTCLRIGHLSFSEFLCDQKRCPERFLIDRGGENEKFAMRCFQRMKNKLKFNICKLQTSYLPNIKVKNLQERIKTTIPSSLMYSCRFWAAHLLDTTSGRGDHDALLKEVTDFLHCRFLYWLEVMSLANEIPTANIALLKAASWIQVRLVSLSSNRRP
jgi:hypothetical protein